MFLLPKLEMLEQWELSEGSPRGSFWGMHTHKAPNQTANKTHIPSHFHELKLLESSSKKDLLLSQSLTPMLIIHPKRHLPLLCPQPSNPALLFRPLPRPMEVPLQPREKPQCIIPPHVHIICFPNHRAHILIPPTAPVWYAFKRVIDTEHDR
jgi:hypothetical protein